MGSGCFISRFKSSSLVSNNSSEISLFIFLAILTSTFKDSVIRVKKPFKDKLDFFLIKANVLEFKTRYLLDSFNQTIESSSEIF